MSLNMFRLCSAAPLLAICSIGGAATPARADTAMEVAFFAGAKFYSEDGALSRPLLRTVPDSAFQNSAVFGVRLGYLPIPRLALEAELGVSPTGMRGPLRYANGDEVPGTQGAIAVIPLRAHLLVNLLTGRFRPFLLLGGGGHLGAPLGPGLLRSDAVGAIHAGTGFALKVRGGFGIRLEGRLILAQGFEQALTPEGEVLFSFYSHFTKAPPPALVPAPPPALPALVPDSDRDGIPDSLDRCPTEAGPVSWGGCPEADTDRDHDGVANDLDRCPDTPGPKENAGCPDTDRDGDGIVDRLDRCPEKPETRNGYQDDDGCPDELPPALQQMTGVIQGISFLPDSAAIAASSYPVLEQAVKILQEHPSVRVEIAGYTDTSGDLEKNRRLSQQRAEAVLSYLQEKGVLRERLQARGYGPEAPIADNQTPQGRARNRRVEFHILP